MHRDWKHYLNQNHDQIYISWSVRLLNIKRFSNMFRFLLVILIIQLSQVVFSQKALVSLTDRNTIYIGIPNAIDFAVEGLRRDEIKITTKGCSIDSQYKYLTASSPGKCNVILSYLKQGLADSQTIVLNVKMPTRSSLNVS